MCVFLVDIVETPRKVPEGIEPDITETKPVETTEDTGVQVKEMNPKPEDRPTSFFAQPGILAGMDVSLCFYLGIIP